MVVKINIHPKYKPTLKVMNQWFYNNQREFDRIMAKHKAK